MKIIISRSLDEGESNDETVDLGGVTLGPDNSIVVVEPGRVTVAPATQSEPSHD